MPSQDARAVVERGKHIRDQATTALSSTQPQGLILYPSNQPSLSRPRFAYQCSLQAKGHHIPPLPNKAAIKRLKRSHSRKYQRLLTMADQIPGFFSSEAERALMGQEEDAQLLFTEQQMISTPYVDEGSNWAHAHTSDSGFDYFHPLPQALGTSYSTLPSSHEFSNYTSSGGAGTETAIAYPPSTSPTSTSSSQYAPTSLSVPSTVSSAAGSSSHAPRPSRSPSPNISDLYNYGTLNVDNRTWRCAYPGCNSKAIFVRPCDLRKHFHRHNKQFFCRHEGCPQAREGGFSSKKDRARHESKHNPGVQCEWEGCERIFSRVDNMRNHMQRSEYTVAHSNYSHCTYWPASTKT